MERRGYAWGPERESFRGQAGYAVLNSVVDAPGVGDERNFVRVREAGTTMTRTDFVEVVPGGRYEVYIYFRNDAPMVTEILEGVTVQSYFSRYASDDMAAVVMAGLRAEGQEMVWDTARLAIREGAVELRYVPGSAVVHSMGAVNGTALDGLFAYPGAELGFDSLNGALPGGGVEYAGYVTYEIEAVAVRGTAVSGEIYGEPLTTVETAASGGTTSGGSGGAAEMPTTGAGGGVIVAVIMGLTVALGWSLLRKVRNCGKIKR